MNQLDKDLAVAQTVVLMTSYSFDLQGYTLEQLISKWLANYHSTWIRLATIEALYLGRYKAVSIEQIMAVWSRLGNPKIHFGGEFERLICRKLPRHLVVDKDVDRVPKSKIKSNSSLENRDVATPKPPLTTAAELSSKVLDSKDPSYSNQPQNESPSVSVEDELAKTQELPSSPSNLEIPKTDSSNSIQGFTPIPDISSLFQKLKAIAKTDSNSLT